MLAHGRRYCSCCASLATPSLQCVGDCARACRRGQESPINLECTVPRIACDACTGAMPASSVLHAAASSLEAPTDVLDAARPSTRRLSTL
eukprot:366229-Chlamydomonas_euryale.AAC.38